MACSKADAEKCLTECFNIVDTDHDGSISARELETILVEYYKSTGKPVDNAKAKKDAEAFLNAVDKNHDHMIEKDEFIGYFRQFFDKK